MDAALQARLDAVTKRNKELREQLPEKPVEVSPVVSQSSKESPTLRRTGTADEPFRSSGGTTGFIVGLM